MPDYHLVCNLYFSSRVLCNQMVDDQAGNIHLLADNFPAVLLPYAKETPTFDLAHWKILLKTLQDRLSRYQTNV